MGFTLVPEGVKNYACRVLEKLLPLPSEGQCARVEIRFFPEAKMWDGTARSYASHHPVARRLPDGTVKFEKRVLFHEKLEAGVGDVVVEVQLDGKRLYLDKAKYDEAKLLGVHRCTNGWYMDELVSGLQ